MGRGAYLSESSPLRPALIDLASPAPACYAGCMGVGKKGFKVDEAVSGETGKTYEKRLGPRTQTERQLTTKDVAKLSQDEIRELNAKRPPSEQIGEYEHCPAPISRNKPELGGCPKPAGWGTGHAGLGYCKMHGGNTAAGRKSAARNYGRALVEAQRSKFGGDPDSIQITPEQAILEEVRRSAAMVRWLEVKIAGWDHDPESGNLDLNGLPRLMDETNKGTATFTDQREWLLMYREERAHMLRASKMAIDVGIAERMVTLAENQANMIANIIRQVLDALRLSPSQQVLVGEVVPPILRSIGTLDPGRVNLPPSEVVIVPGEDDL